MNKKHNLSAGTLGAVAVAGALGAVAVAGALMMAAPVAAYAQPANGPETFIIIVTGNVHGRIIASGQFGATGKIIDETPNATDNTDLSKAIFPGVGSFLIRITQTDSTASFNPHTCVDRFTFTDTLTFGDGTGQFAGISGTGTDHGRGTFVAKRNQTGCNQNKNSGYVIIRVNAELTFSAPSRG